MAGARVFNKPVNVAVKSTEIEDLFAPEVRGSTRRFAFNR
jgi:hypothetical protein